MEQSNCWPWCEGAGWQTGRAGPGRVTNGTSGGQDKYVDGSAAVLERRRSPFKIARRASIICGRRELTHRALLKEFFAQHLSKCFCK